ncbi:MAG: hypothetical protein ACXVA9_13800 [Bdellovibrionales bacterium]
MSENKEIAAKREAADKLWLDTEKKIAEGLNPEDLRTSGILAANKRRWNASLVRLSEAALFGLRDMQLLDALGEASYRTRTPEALIPYAAEFREPLIATHMARALMDLGEYETAGFYVTLATPSPLRRAIHAMLGFKGSIEAATQAMITPVDEALRTPDSPFLNLDYPAFWNALSAIADVVGREDLVNLAEERSKALNFENPGIHYNQALRLLGAGQLRAGWSLYDWRLHPDANKGVITNFADTPMWQGENLAGKTLAVVLEYGYGDQIFSLRFVKEALARLKNSKIELVVRPEVFDLVAASFPALKIHKFADARSLGPFDFWCYAFSLPARMDLSTPVATEGYLSAPSNKSIAEKIRDEKGGRTLPVYGLVWQGDIATHAMRTRAYSIAEFLDQTAVLKEPALIVNLQKDITREELKYLEQQVSQAGGRLIDASTELRDFAATAAWVTALDRLYSCDTAVAHLGGALGAPTTVLVRNRMIWHWIERKNSDRALWYDSATIQFALTPKFSYMFDLRI